jgi:hypothetical protein
MTIAEDGPATRSAAPSSIAEALCDLIGSITFEQPVLIFLDDVHLADSHSRYILETTWDFIRGHRLLMVITELSPASDHVEEPENSDVRQTLSLGALSLAQATKLATLVSSPSGRRLNEEVAALVATASDRTPLDVVTLSREHLVTGITAPEKRSLVDTLVAQLLRLPPRARALTQAVALLGGRASPGVVATVLEIPLCDRLDALAVLLDAGILKETENGAVCCHHEVSQAALRTLREPEANVLRRGLALAFDGLLAESFSPDYAVSMLSLALDSKDASLFTRLCISHARSLARTGMARGAVRFLESALRVSTAPEITHSLLAVLADVAQHEAHWRGVLNATRAMCALPSHKESPLSIELQLSGLEGLIHTSLHTEGLSCGHAAQRVAEDHSLAPGLRTRAARIALTAASELFDVHLGMAANSVVEELSQAYPDDELSLREPRMQYHTIFGSLNTAELEALSILSHAAEHARTAAGLRALINASAVLRISGKSTLALDCLDACASSPLLLGNASRRADIAWRRCVIALDAEHRSEAIARYGELRASLTESGEEGELWARLFALRMELVTNGDIRDVSAALRVTEEGRFHPNRLMLYCCALCLNSSQFRARDSEYASMLRRGTQWLLEFGRYSGLDFLAASVLGRLEAGGDPRHAAEAADRYFRIDRRERSPIGVAFEALSPSLRVHIAEASS